MAWCVWPERQMSVVSLKSFAWIAGLVLFSLTQVAVARADDMSFRLVSVGNPAKCKSQCVDAIAADGEITNSTPEAFVAFIMRTFRDPKVRSVVLLNSPGGRVVASMQLGLALRKVGALAVVARAGAGAGVVTTGGCYSACVYALMGAVKRVVPQGSKVGIHRMFTYEWERDNDETIKRMRVYGSSDLSAQLSDYAASMGVSRDLIATAEQINPDTIHILTPKEILRWRLASLKF
jgi:hypothetical protein